MKKIIFILIFYSLFITHCIAQWQPDVRLTNDTANSYTSPNNAWCIASSGIIVHVVWFDNRDGNYEIYYKRSTDGGINWEADTRLTNNIADSYYPSIKVNGSIVHVVWIDKRDGGEWVIYYKRSTDGGVSWGIDTRLSSGSPTSTSTCPSISAIGSAVHVAWGDNRDGNWEIYYKRSTNSGVNWETDTRLTNDTSASYWSSIAVSSSIVNVVWRDERDGNTEVYYKRSTDGGASWEADTRLTNNSANSYTPSVSVSSSIVHVVWWDDRNGNDEIYYKRSTDGGASWGQDTRLTYALTGSEYPNISVSDSILHVVWRDERDGNGEIYYKRSTDGGVSWETDTRLTNNSGTSDYPSVSVSGQVVHVVWVDKRDGGNYEIYYKRNPTGNSTLKANLNSIYRPNDGRTQIANITLSDSLCTGTIDSVFWYVNDSLVGRQHTMTYPFRQGSTLVKLKIKNNYGSADSTTATVTRIAYKKYTNGQILAGLSLIGDSVFYAISTGDAVYRKDINGNTVFTLSVGGNVLSSCSIGFDTTVFIGSSDNNLYGFNKNGVTLWSPISLGASVTATPTVDSISNRLFVGVSNGNFFAINKTTGGVPVWSYFCNSPVKSSAVISLDRKLVVASSVGTVYGFNLNLPNPSPPSWVLNLSDSILVSPAIDSSGYFYFGSQSGMLYKVELTGVSTATIIWQIDLGSAVTSSPVIDSWNNIYVGTANGRLYSIKSYGPQNWYFQTDSIIKSTPVITSNGRIYFGNNKGEIFGLDSNKNVKFYYIDSAKISCAMLYNKGTIYFGNEAGRLFAIYDTTGGTLERAGIYAPMWGTFQNNNRRTGNLGDGPGHIGIHKISVIIPSQYALYQNYPNPFNPVTTIKFDLPKQSEVKIIVYDILGRETAVLVDKKMGAGIYEVQWNTNEFSSGVYFYKLITGRFVDTKKMILLK